MSCDRSRVEHVLVGNKIRWQKLVGWLQLSSDRSWLATKSGDRSWLVGLNSLVDQSCFIFGLFIKRAWPKSWRAVLVGYNCQVTEVGWQQNQVTEVGWQQNHVTEVGWPELFYYWIVFARGKSWRAVLVGYNCQVTEAVYFYYWICWLRKCLVPCLWSRHRSYGNVTVGCVVRDRIAVVMWP